MDEINKIANEVPPSTIPLPQTSEHTLDYEKISKDIDRIYKLCDSDIDRCYRKGKMIKITADTPTTTVLTHIIGLYIDKVRTQLDELDSEERKKDLQIELNRIQKALQSVVELLRSEDFKLDIYSALHIIHGYTSGNMPPVFEHYETRRRITHKHEGT